jgi:hypothetical protein
MSDLEAGAVHFVFLAITGCVIVVLLGRDREAQVFQLRLFLCAFILRFACSLIIYQLGLVTVLKDEDSSGWVVGVQLQEHWLRHGVDLWQLPSVLAGAFVEQNKGYQYLLGAVFFLTGAPSRLAAAALNGFFGALTIVGVWHLAGRLFSRWVAAQAAWWACFLPSMIVWSAQTIKEPVVILLETIALYSCIRLRQLGPSPRHLALCAATILLLMPFRFYACYIVAVVVAVSLLVRGLVPGRAICASVALLALLIPAIFGTQSFLRRTAELERFDLNYAQSFRRAVASGAERWGGRSGVRSADIRTTGGLVSGSATGAAHLLLAPFPWELGKATVRMLLVVPELIVWWWLFFGAVVPGLWYSLRHRLIDISPLLLVLVAFGLLYSVLFGNVGLAFRQRAQLLPWLLIFAAVGLEQRRLRRAVAPPAWEDTLALPGGVPSGYARPVSHSLSR